MSYTPYSPDAARRENARDYPQTPISPYNPQQPFLDQADYGQQHQLHQLQHQQHQGQLQQHDRPPLAPQHAVPSNGAQTPQEMMARPRPTYQNQPYQHNSSDSSGTNFDFGFPHGGGASGTSTPHRGLHSYRNAPGYVVSPDDTRSPSEWYPDSRSSTPGPHWAGHGGDRDSRSSQANLLRGYNPYQPNSQPSVRPIRYSTAMESEVSVSELTLAQNSDLNITPQKSELSVLPPKGATSTLAFYNSSSSTIFSRDWKRDGSIIKVHNRDDVDHMASWKRYLFKLTPIFILASMVTYIGYLILRIYCVQSAQKAQKEAYPLAWIFIGIELCVILPTFMHLFMTLFMFFKPRNRQKLRLCGDDVPAVDVFVTCCKEEVDLIADTVRAACTVDYPIDRFRVILLDDGADPALQEEIESMQETYPNVYYRSREKIPGKPHHFKAGNLNYGFEEVTRLPGGAAQFAAALDADMIPEREWLRALLPHMLVDERTALACPPQLFYNVPRNDPLNQSLDFFVHVLEGIKDGLGVAWCTGSGYVLRREALEEIGWFPLGSLAEDVATSTLMLGKGWKTAFVHEPLQWGTVPDSFGAHLKQRTRWVSSHLSIQLISKWKYLPLT
jgi:hypothetical protein